MGGMKEEYGVFSPPDTVFCRNIIFIMSQAFPESPCLATPAAVRVQSPPAWRRIYLFTRLRHTRGAARNILCVRSPCTTPAPQTKFLGGDTLRVRLFGFFSYM